MSRNSTMFAVSIAVFVCLGSSIAIAQESQTPSGLAPSVGFRSGGTYLGVMLEEEIDHPDGGARVTRVVDGSPADEAGLEAGDVIVGVGDRVVRGPSGLQHILSDRKSGDRVSLRVRRDGREIELDATLADRQAFSRTFTFDGNNWEEFGERMADMGEEWGNWGEALGKDLAEKFGNDSNVTIFSGEDWSEEHAENLAERMIELQERLADLQIDMPNLDFPERMQNYFVCDDGDCDVEFKGLLDRPVLGVHLVETTRELRGHLGGDEERGVLVSKVVDGSVAEAAGIAVGDMIVRVGDADVRSSSGLRRALGGLAGQSVSIELVRDGRNLVVDADFPEASEREPFTPKAGLLGTAPKVASVPAVHAYPGRIAVSTPVAAPRLTWFPSTVTSSLRPAAPAPRVLASPPSVPRAPRPARLLQFAHGEASDTVY